MPTHLIALLATFFVIGLSGPAYAEPVTGLPLVLATAMAAGNTPAAGVLVLRDGRVADIAVRGVRRVDGADPVQLNDAWMIGSTSKSQTVAMIARLADRGVLSWRAPLSKMLPDLAAGMRPEYRGVTLTQLLSHHSGLPENISDMAFFETFFTDRRPASEQRLAYITRALSEAPAYPPGTAFGYSNTGFLIAALVAERATGLTYERLMRREVFGPLGMTSAGFGALGPGGLSGHEAGKPAPASNPDMFAPAGNLHMSLRDWSRFCLDQLAGAKGHGKLLSPPAYRLMQTAQPNGPSGLDWGVQARIAGRTGPVLVHGGSDGRWFAYVVLFPGSGNGVLVVDNASTAMGGDTAALAVLASLLPSLAPEAVK